MNDDPLNHDEKLRLAERIAYLIAGHLNGTLTEAESDELDDWITESDENLELFEKLTDEDNIQAAMNDYMRQEKEKAAAFASLQSTIRSETKKSLVRRLWPYAAVAAVVIIGGLLYFLSTKNNDNPNEKPVARKAVKSDVQAGSDKAVLTLSDGRTIILDSMKTGLLAQDGTVRIQQNEDGEITYTGTDSTMAYNVVATPRGGQYQITLGDGTKVWLNADSYLKFPAGLKTAPRNVELRGEAYFEVAKNSERPFTVNVRTPIGEGGIVKVLGTHFNINGYGDDGSTTTTLLEGSVQIEKSGVTKLLQPGEKAITTSEIKISKTNVEEAVAWKNNKFLFRDAPIRSIGEQIKRWYDVDVEYRGTISQHFNTEASRDIPLSQLLEGLEGTTQVHFELSGKHLVIKP